MAAPSRPPRQVCPLCANDDEVELRSDGPDLWTFVCRNGHPVDPYEWSPTPVEPGGEAPTGITAELGLYDALLRCVHPGEWVEYGVVEFRLAVAEPDTYKRLLELYGHASIAPTRYSTSSFVAHTLSQLHREGLLSVEWTASSGYWSYLSRVSAWALPQTGPGEVLSWAEFAESIGVDPRSWPPTTGV